MVYKLYYFPVRGRCDFIRYLLHYAGIPYEEITITLDEWRNGAKQSKHHFLGNQKS